jgi:hypothetical protein
MDVRKIAPALCVMATGHWRSAEVCHGATETRRSIHQSLPSHRQPSVTIHRGPESASHLRASVSPRPFTALPPQLRSESHRHRIRSHRKLGRKEAQNFLGFGETLPCAYRRDGDARRNPQPFCAFLRPIKKMEPIRGDGRIDRSLSLKLFAFRLPLIISSFVAENPPSIHDPRTSISRVRMDPPNISASKTSARPACGCA